MDLVNLGKEPIAGDNPAGSDVRYEPEFENLQNEIDKLASPSAGQVDWKSIVDIAAGILSRRSKDLSAASYLAVGLIRTQNADGLALGTRILKDLLETYWDTLYPPKKRMRGRAGAITWWFERSMLELKRFAPASLPGASAERVYADLKRLEELLAAQLPDAPRLGPLLRLVESLSPPKTAAAESGAPAAQAAPMPVSTEPAPVAQVSEAKSQNRAPQAGETITNSAEARKALETMLQRMRQASLFLLQHDLKDPMAYRYRRISSWARLLVLPPNSDGSTQITSPAPQVRDALTRLYEENNWPVLIENCEQKLSQFVFWFDLNRYTAEALSALGDDHAAAQAAVCQETAFLTQRLPGVERLRFADGMPFADDQSLAWLQGIRPAGEGQGVASAALNPPAEADRYQKVLRDAQNLVRGKKIVEAVEHLQQQFQKGVGRHERLRWQMAIAQVLLNAKKHSAALPHLEQMLQEIEMFRLEEWDPTLALEGFISVWQGFGAQSAAEYKPRASAILQRIARIDPLTALRLSG